VERLRRKDVGGRVRYGKGVPVIANAIATPVDDPEEDTDEITFHVMSPEEAWERFDEAARHYLHMGGDAFIQAWDAGAFDEHPDHSNVVCVYMLSPLGR
jgi:hypothetical protein